MKPKNGRLKFTQENISPPVLLVLKFWDIPCKMFLLRQNGFLLSARARVKMEENVDSGKGLRPTEFLFRDDW